MLSSQAGTCPSHVHRGPASCDTLFPLLLPLKGFCLLEGWLLTPLWPELGAPLWSVALLGWGLLAEAPRPFLQRQLLWPGLHLVFQALFSCPVGQYIIREHLQALHADRDLSTSSQVVGRKPTRCPTTFVSGTPGHPVPRLCPAVPPPPPYPGLPPPACPHGPPHATVLPPDRLGEGM